VLTNRSIDIELLLIALTNYGRQCYNIWQCYIIHVYECTRSGWRTAAVL